MKKVNPKVQFRYLVGIYHDYILSKMDMKGHR